MLLQWYMSLEGPATALSSTVTEGLKLEARITSTYVNSQALKMWCWGPCMRHRKPLFRVTHGQYLFPAQMCMIPKSFTSCCFTRIAAHRHACKQPLQQHSAFTPFTTKSQPTTTTTNHGFSAVDYKGRKLQALVTPLWAVQVTACWLCTQHQQELSISLLFDPHSPRCVGPAHPHRCFLCRWFLHLACWVSLAAQIGLRCFFACHRPMAPNWRGSEPGTNPSLEYLREHRRYRQKGEHLCHFVALRRSLAGPA